MDTELLTAAAGLGVLAGSAPGPGPDDGTAVGSTVLGLLATLIPSDASALQVVGAGPSRSVSTRTLASRGFAHHWGDAVAADWMRTPDLDYLRAAWPPPTLSADTGRRRGDDFLEGSFYRQHLAPEGFVDGMSVHLVDADGATAGFAHFSARTPRFGPAEQARAGALVPVLNAVVTRARNATTAPRPQAAAAFLDARGLHPLPGTDAPAVVGDPRLARVLSTLRAAPGRRLGAWWDAGGTWYRVVAAPEPAGHPDRLLVRVEPGELPCGLSRRELDVLTCVAAGMSNADIAGRLAISVRTVHTHVDAVRWKTGSASRVHAAAWAHREGVLHLAPDASADDVRLLLHRL
ncbi:response regulator transcription factor [Kineococcus sp. DHX-1]|uniref:response regulator transcription factor n=1 Tax=Kineococcus sp. DHX-1 TaxID=3349638 RepID=UPI0036D277B6